MSNTTQLLQNNTAATPPFFYDTMKALTDFKFWYTTANGSTAGDYIFGGLLYNGTDVARPRATKNTSGLWELFNKDTISDTGQYTKNIFQLQQLTSSNSVGGSVVSVYYDFTKTLPDLIGSGKKFFFHFADTKYIYYSVRDVKKGTYYYDDDVTLRTATINANGDWVLHTGATISTTGLYTAAAYVVNSNSTTTTNTTANSSATTGSTSTNTTTTSTINQVMDANLTSYRGVVNADGIAEALSILTSITANADQIKLTIARGAVKIELADNVKFNDLTADEAFTRVVNATEAVNSLALNITGDSNVKKVTATELNSSGNANITGNATVVGKIKAEHVEADYIALKAYPANAIPTNLPPYSMFAIQKAN